jgi:hypothetical protein
MVSRPNASSTRGQRSGANCSPIHGNLQGTTGVPFRSPFLIPFSYTTQTTQTTASFGQRKLARMPEMLSRTSIFPGGFWEFLAISTRLPSRVTSSLMRVRRNDHATLANASLEDIKTLWPEAETTMRQLRRLFFNQPSHKDDPATAQKNCCLASLKVLQRTQKAVVQLYTAVYEDCFDDKWMPPALEITKQKVADWQRLNPRLILLVEQRQHEGLPDHFIDEVVWWRLLRDHLLDEVWKRLRPVSCLLQPSVSSHGVHRYGLICQMTRNSF